jgi:hypothetical protein
VRHTAHNPGSDGRDDKTTKHFYSLSVCSLLALSRLKLTNFLLFRCKKNGGGGREWRKVALADTDTLARGNGSGKNPYSISSASFILFWKGETARKLRKICNIL